MATLAASAAESSVVTEHILDHVMEPNQYICDLWEAIEGLFQANKELGAIYLQQEFHSMKQGDLSIADY